MVFLPTNGVTAMPVFNERDPPTENQIICTICEATVAIEGGAEYITEWQVEPGKTLSEFDREKIAEFMKKYPHMTAIAVDRTRRP